MSIQTVSVERRRRKGLLIVGVALYAWIAGHFETFTWPAAVITFIPGAIGLIAGTRLRRESARRQGLHRQRFRRLGWVAWVLVIGAMLGLEAYGFFLGSSASGHPTISNIVNHGLHTTATRALAFFGWLAFGNWLLER